jgi:hypothetical protein
VRSKSGRPVATEDDGSCQIDLGNSNTSNNDNNDGSSDDIEDKTEGVMAMIPGGIIGVGAIAAVVVGLIGWMVVSKN